MKLKILSFSIAIFIGLAAKAQLTVASNNLEQKNERDMKLLANVLKDFQNRCDINFVYGQSLMQDKYIIDNAITFSKGSEGSPNQQLSKINLRLKKVDTKFFVVQHKEENATISTENNLVKEIIISGKVSDEKGEGIPGVNVTVKGKQVGSITDILGVFSIKVADEKAVLVFSAISYLSKEVVVGNQMTMNITLIDDIKNLQEVIVVGYSAEKKSDQTGAIVSMSAKDIEKLQVSSIDQALQGKAAGVNVTQNTGAPGEGSTINIRGVGSINGNTPLFIIDGVPTQDGFNIISPNDIETISILKDAASAAIYGARAANGVILVTTKKGKTGEPRINFTSFFGVQQAGRLIPMANTQDYIKIFNQAADNDNALIGEPSLFRKKIPIDLQLADTDWQKAILQTGTMQNYQLSVSGGTEKMHYLISGGYFDQKGIIINSGYSRYNLRTNIDTELSRKLKLGTNINLSFSNRNIVGSSGDGYGGNGGSVVRYALFRTPAIPIYNTDGLFSDLPEFPQFFGDGYNPVGLVTKADNTEKQYRLLGNIFAEYKILDNLKFKTDGGIDLNINNVKTFSENWGTNLRINSPSSLTTRAGVASSFNWNNTLLYNKAFNGKHNLTVLLGTEAIQSINKVVGGTDRGFLDQIQNLRYLGQGITLTKGIFEGDSRWSLFSLFGRATYAYDDKYLFAANIRRDGSSRFSPTNRFGTFYSASAGWNIDREDFMQKYSDVISLLKIKASIGQLGNQDIGNYPWASFVNNGFNYPLGVEQATNIGYTITSRGNANVQWESSTQIDLGLEGGLFRNKIIFSIDYFIKKTSDMLIPIPVPKSGGGAGVPYVNAGSIENKGLELQLTYRNKVGAFEYDISANASMIKNKVLSLNNGNPIPGGRIDNGIFATLTEVGNPIGSFYLYEMEGIFQNKTQIFTHAYQGNNIQPGDVMYRDVNSDGIIDEKDRTHVGSPIPTLTYGLTINLQYKNFDLSAFMQGVLGNKVYYQVATDIEGFYRSFNVTQRVVDEHWQGEGTSNTQPRVSWAGAANNKLPSTRFLEDGAYTRLRNLQIGYTFPEIMTGKMKIRKLRVYLSGQNLLTLTKYPGLDPEMQTSDNVNNEQFKGPVAVGIDWGTYPSARTYSMGVNVNF